MSVVIEKCAFIFLTHTDMDFYVRSTVAGRCHRSFFHFSSHFPFLLSNFYFHFLFLVLLCISSFFSITSYVILRWVFVVPNSRGPMIGRGT